MSQIQHVSVKPRDIYEVVHRKTAARASERLLEFHLIILEIFTQERRSEGPNLLFPALFLNFERFQEHCSLFLRGKSQRRVSLLSLPQYLLPLHFLLRNPYISNMFVGINNDLASIFYLDDEVKFENTLSLATEKELPAQPFSPFRLGVTQAALESNLQFVDWTFNQWADRTSLEPGLLS